MNLSDLRDELATRADDLGPTTDLRAGVADGVRRTKRRRAVATGSAATLAVAALAVGVLTSVGRPAPPAPATPPATSAAPVTGTDGMPFRTVPDAPGDVVKDGLRLRARVADDALVAGTVGDRGQTRISASWTPTSTHVALTGTCVLPGAPADVAERYQVRVRVEGMTGYFGSGCTGTPAGRDLTADWTPGDPGAGWSELTPGRPATLVVEVVEVVGGTRGAAVTLPDVQLAGAVYEVGEETSVRDVAGTTVVALPDVLEHEGYRYRIASVTSSALASGPLPRVAAPSGPALVTWGSSGDGLAAATADSSLRLTGLPGSDGGRSLGSWGTDPVPAGSTGTLALAAEGQRPDHGTAFLAVYTLIP
ncbi:hypothetical protein [Terrabacter sp. NPDC000476]|uniref:hypothetical protein n=1 Tax=Terrabacter sp. NPDC000476 TaxID=3154258 RepID=UPI0033200877